MGGSSSGRTRFARRLAQLAQGARGGVAWTALTNVGLAVFAALTSIALARFFGPGVRGQYASITAIVGTAAAVTAFGAPAYLGVQAAGRGAAPAADLDIRASTRFVSGVALLCTGAPCLVLALAERLTPPLAATIVAYTTVSVNSVILLNLALAKGNWLAFNLGRLAFFPLNLLAMTVARLAGVSNIEQLVALSLLANVGCLVVQWRLADKSQARGSGPWLKTGAKAYLRGAPFGFNTILGSLSSQADVLGASVLLGPIAVGYWAAAKTLANVVSPINHSVSASTFSLAARRELRADASFYLSFRFLTAVNLALTCGIALFAAPVTMLVFGRAFLPSSALAGLASAGVGASALAELCEERVRGAGKPHAASIARATQLTAFVAILAVLWFARAMDIRAIAMAVLLSQIARAAAATAFVLNLDAVSPRALLPTTADLRVLRDALFAGAHPAAAPVGAPAG